MHWAESPIDVQELLFLRYIEMKLVQALSIVYVCTPNRNHLIVTFAFISSWIEAIVIIKGNIF